MKPWWYKENKTENIRFEDYDNQYDNNMNYIGKGPIGYYELLAVVSRVAKRLQLEGKIANPFGDIPIFLLLSMTWNTQGLSRKQPKTQIQMVRLLYFLRH